MATSGVWAPQVHVAMLGARQHYAVPKLLQRSGLLGRFYTDVYVNPHAFLPRLIKAIPSRYRAHWMERLLGRADAEIAGNKIVSYGAFGVWYQWQIRRARDLIDLSGVYFRGAQSFNSRIIRKGLNGADVVYGFDGAALELFQYAKDRGIPCVLEQTIVPQVMVEALLRTELERWPGWEPGLRIGNGKELFQDRQEAEWRLADLIIGASSYVIGGLTSHRVPESKCRVVPYGIALDQFSPVREKTPRSSSKLHILFVGGVGLRKGVPYLLEALRALDSAEIKMKFAGPIALSPDILKTYQSTAEFLGPVPRSQMANLYQWADLFVLPSICEGSALVTYEALASGIPAIVTPNTGAWVQSEVDGLVVPTGDVNALAAAIERFRQDREFLRFCSRNAVAGREQLGLDAYQARLEQVVRQVCPSSRLS